MNCQHPILKGLRFESDDEGIYGECETCGCRWLEYDDDNYSVVRSLQPVKGVPTQDGLYWYIRPDPLEPQIVMIKHGKVWAHGALGGGPIEALDRGRWFGPLEAPR